MGPFPQRSLVWTFYKAKILEQSKTFALLLADQQHRGAASSGFGARASEVSRQMPQHVIEFSRKGTTLAQGVEKYVDIRCLGDGEWRTIAEVVRPGLEPVGHLTFPGVA